MVHAFEENGQVAREYEVGEGVARDDQVESE